MLLNVVAEPSLNDRTPTEKALGHTPDISPFLHHKFYDPVYYYDDAATFPNSREKLGHWLGPADTFGDALTYYILTDKLTVLVRSTLWTAKDPETLNLQRPTTLPDEGGTLQSIFLRFFTILIVHQRLFLVD